MGKHYKKRKINYKLVIDVIFIMILINILIYSIYNTILWIKDNYKVKNIQNNIAKEVIEDNTTSENCINIDFKKMKEVNNDITGWIRIENTKIDYPIVKAKDNNYYLKHDLYNEYNKCGWIFMDYRNEINFSDINTTIYGHNMKSGTMFGNLKKICNGELGNNIDIDIYLEGRKLIYKVFSTYIKEPSLDIINNEIDLEKLEKKSKIHFEVDTTMYSRKILTLITCDAGGMNRVVVHGILTNE